MENRSNGMLFVGVLVAIIAVGVALITTYFDGNQSDDTGSIAVVETGDQRAFATAGDADNDGVPDWKEILWSTDPQNPDSDGDGIGDAEEIASGSNPTGESVDDTYIAPSALTPTEAVSRELFAGYAEYRQDGILDISEANSAVSEVLGRNIAAQAPATTYDLSDLSIESDVSVSAYETALATTFRKMTEIREYELVTFGRAVESEDFAELEKLNHAAAVYTEVVADILAMEVPTALASQHLEVVNSLSALGGATGALTTWSGDPLYGLDLINNFVEAENTFASHISTLYALINNIK